MPRPPEGPKRLRRARPTGIDDDVDAAMAVNRRTLIDLPNYRNYWREAGYTEEMDAVDAAVDANEPDRIPDALSDKWLADCTLFGPAAKVLDGLNSWTACGVKTPTLVPSSANGGQMKGFEKMFALFEG